MKRPQKILLRREKPQDTPEIETGVVRIEEVVIIYSDQSEEIDYNAGFKYQFIEEDDSSYSQMIRNISSDYNIDESSIVFDEN